MKSLSKNKLPFGLRLAKLVIKKSTVKIKIGASLITSNKIIAVACNETKGSPSAKRWYRFHDQGTHAEFNLFDRTSEPGQIKGTVSVCRLLANGDFGLAKPCASCLAMLRYMMAPGSKIIYTTYGGWTKEKL